MQTDREIEEGIEVKPRSIYSSPKRTDIFGKAAEFVDEVRENLDNKDLYACMGVDSDKTFLVYGPPGTGKTLSIDVLNNECNQGILKRLMEKGEGKEIQIKAQEFNLMVFKYDIGKYGTAYINMGSRRVQEFFDKVGMYAQLGVPVLIEMDECDSLFQSRTSHVQSHSEDRKVLETLMKNIQVAHDTPNMFLVAMTNLPEICDDAVLRSGRIDKKIKFDLPDYESRKHAFEMEVKRLNGRAMYKVIQRVDYSLLAEMSEGFNYADISTSVQQAVRERARKYVKEKGIKLANVSQKGLEQAVLDVKNRQKKCEKTKIGF